MTVKELIERLSKYSPELQVQVQEDFSITEDRDFDWYPPGDFWVWDGILHIGGAKS